MRQPLRPVRGHVQIFGWVAAALLVSQPALAQQAPRDTIGIAILARAMQPASRPSLMRGLEMGVAEAEKTAGLLNVPLKVRWIDTSHSDAVAGIIDAATRAGEILVIGDVDPSLAAAAAERAGGLVLNAGVDFDDALSCDSTILHVRPDRALREAALAATGDSDVSTMRVVAWHGALDRYGAEQLNNRYRDRFGTGLDEDAWLGWLAVKIAFEAALRRGDTDPLSALRAGLAFDGHKGTPLVFDARSGRLLQTLYVVRVNAGEATEAMATLSRDAVQDLVTQRCAATEQNS